MDTSANIWCEGIGSSMLMRYSAIGQSLSAIIGSYGIIFSSTKIPALDTLLFPMRSDKKVPSLSWNSLELFRA